MPLTAKIGVMGQPDPRRWKALAVLGTAFLMGVLDATIVNTALPTIQRELLITTASLQWIVSGYALTFGGFLLLAGRMGDLLGRRRVFMIGLALFSLSSLLCGLSGSEQLLICARLLQGAAAATLSPSVFSIVLVLFREGSERNKALGLLGGLAGAGGPIGGVLGGVITTGIGWQWVFFVNVPVGLITLALVPRYVPESRADGMARHFDSAGAITVTSGLMALVFALTQSTRHGWGSGLVLGAFVASAALLTAFALIELRSHEPLVPFSFFRRRMPAAANAVGFTFACSLFGVFLLMTLYMQQVLGYSALRASLAGMPIGLTSIAFSNISPRIVTRLGPRPVLAFGLTLVAICMAYLTHLPAQGSYVVDLLPAFLVLGLGMGCSFVPISIAALAGISGREAGLASGMINTSQQIGGALGLALLATIADSRTHHLFGSGESRPAAMTHGFTLAFSAAMGLALAAAALVLILMPRREPLQEQPAPLAQKPAPADHRSGHRA
jgi:EmrB/QacA subfamily drug resistance transporter